MPRRDHNIVVLHDAVHLVGVSGFAPKIQFFESQVDEVARQSGEIHAQDHAVTPAEARRSPDKRQVHPKGLLDSRTHYLDGNRLARVEDSCVHLRNGGGSEGNGVEFPEHFGNGAMQIALHHLPDYRRGNRGHAIEKLRQFQAVLRRDQIVARGQHLSRLDETSPAGLEKPAQRHRSGIAVEETPDKKDEQKYGRQEAYLQGSCERREGVHGDSSE